MSEFLTEYGMFLAQVVTLVLAALFIMAGIASASRQRQFQDEEQGQIRVRHLNRELDQMRDGVQEAVLPAAQRKKARKERKREEKARQKAEKKAPAPRPQRPRVFVLDFDGDIRASAVGNLRREINAVLRVAGRDDEVVVRLESPGGLVHGYGLAASQLRRIRDNGSRLTVCVDKVAASGGYMMACIAERILSAPFAVVGSIGVVAQIPNFHRLLKRNDIDVEVVTAGEYKRTLTLFGENTEKGRQKFQEEIEDTHNLFKDFVREHRRSLDLDRVATGEHWFGTRARELGLVDEIMTSDEYLLGRCEEADVYEVSWHVKQKLAERLGFSAEAVFERVLERWFYRGVGRFWQ